MADLKKESYKNVLVTIHQMSNKPDNTPNAWGWYSYLHSANGEGLEVHKKWGSSKTKLPDGEYTFSHYHIKTSDKKDRDGENYVNYDFSGPIGVEDAAEPHNPTSHTSSSGAPDLGAIMSRLEVAIERLEALWEKANQSGF